MSNTPIVRDVLDNGLRILTEPMTQVRSVSIGVWLTRGSRHETAERGGIAHFVEHMRLQNSLCEKAPPTLVDIYNLVSFLQDWTTRRKPSRKADALWS